MRKRTLICALAGTLACPAGAVALTQIEPPDGDAYLKPVSLSAFKHPEPFPRRAITLTADTTSYSEQDDLFDPGKGGGPPEPTRCDGAAYGKTLWVVFHADRWGVMRVTAATGFDSVIALVPFQSPDTPAPDLVTVRCWNAATGPGEAAAALVRPGRWYAVQFGGTGETRGGSLQTTFNLEPPPTVRGRPLLDWERRPLRVTDLRVRHLARGARVTLSCTQGACVRRTVAAGRKGSVRLLDEQRVRPGTRIEVRIRARGRIGRVYRWKAARGRIGEPEKLCTNPGSRKPRERCRG